MHLRISHFILSHKIFDNQLDHNSVQVNAKTFILTIYEKNIKPICTFFKSTDFSRVNVINESIDIVSEYDKGGQ